MRRVLGHPVLALVVAIFLAGEPEIWPGSRPVGITLWTVAFVVGVFALAEWRGWAFRSPIVRPVRTSPHMLPPPRHSSPAAAQKAPIVTSPASPPVEEDRIFIDRTPEQLIAEFQGVTAVQGEARVALCIGKWIRVSGPLGNVISISPTKRMVSFAGRSGMKDLVFMFFNDKGTIERLDVKSVGDPITVIGSIESVDPIQVKLERCELET